MRLSVAAVCADGPVGVRLHGALCVHADLPLVSPLVGTSSLTARTVGLSASPGVSTGAGRCL